MRVLFVEPPCASSDALRRYLETQGWCVKRMTDLKAASREAEGLSVDVAVLDASLGLLEPVAALGRHTAVLVLARDGDPLFPVEALEAGADDCLSAPYNRRELVARIRALVRRRRAPARFGGRHRVFDGHQFDAVNLIVRSPDGREVRITPMQSRLLAALLARPREVVSREQLLERVLGEESCSFDRAIDVHVSRLKRRLARVTDQDLIMACRGAGYRLDVQDVTP